MTGGASVQKARARAGYLQARERPRAAQERRVDGVAQDDVRLKIKEMMGPYRKVHDIVKFVKICKMVGARIYDMPDGFRNKCYNHMMGKCHVDEDKCGHQHVSGSALAEGDVDVFVEKIKPGVDKVTEEGPDKGRGNKRKRGRRVE